MRSKAARNVRAGEGVGAEERGRSRSAASARPGVVYTAPPIALATVVAEAEGRFRVSVHGAERDARLDGSVDPAVVREAMRAGSRVVVEAGPEPVIVGTLVTARSLTVDREGNVSADVERFEIRAHREALLRTSGAFVRIEARKIEQYATELRIRGRDLVQALAAIIRLN